MTSADIHNSQGKRTRPRGPIAIGKAEPQDKLAAAMKEEGWPIQELAHQIGVDRSTVRHIIQGKFRPRREVADGICEVLGLKWEDLFTYRRPKYRGEH